MLDQLHHPPNQLPPEEREAFYDKYLYNDQLLYDDDPDNDDQVPRPDPTLGE